MVLALPAAFSVATESPTDSESTELNNPNPQSCGVTLDMPDYLVRNTDDDQEPSSEYYEKWDLDHAPSPDDDDLKVVTVTGTAGQTGGTLTLEITGGSDKIAGTFWKDAEKNEQQDELSWDVDANSSRSETLYIEGYDHSGEKNDVKLKATIECPAGVGEDGENYSAASAETTGETTVYEADLDVDSNNNEETEFTEGSKDEDEIESSQKTDVDGWPKRPGKLIVANTGNTDGVPDWADGFNINESSMEDDQLDSGQADFVEILLERKTPFTAQCEVKFNYDGSDPKAVSVTTEDESWNPNHTYSYKLGQDGKFRIWRKESATPRDKQDAPDGDYVPDDVWIKWSDLSEDSGSIIKLYVEGVRPSGSLGDLSVEVTIREEDVEASDKIVVTCFEFSSEPVCSSGVSSLRGHMEEPINPAGVSGGAYAGYFEVTVEPKNFPDEKINWSAMGGWSTSASGKFGFVNSGSVVGQGQVNIDIEGVYTPEPKFKGQSLPLKTIGAKCVVIRDSSGNNPAIGDSSASDVEIIDQILGGVNRIWRQAGLVFEIDGDVTYIDNSSYTDGLTYWEMYEIVSSFDVSEDEIEIYFVPTIEGDALGMDVRLSGESGLFVACANLGSQSASSDVSGVLAHEIGHAFYLKDIYLEIDGLNDSNEWATCIIPRGIPASVNYLADDWNGDYWLAPRYYPQEIVHRDVINRVLMNGFKSDWDGGEFRDIPNGRIFGCRYERIQDNFYIGVSSGNVDVGINTLLDHDRKSHH